MTDFLTFFRTLPDKEIRRRQDLCEQQQNLAFASRNDKAMANLSAMSDALMQAMLERC